MDSAKLMNEHKENVKGAMANSDSPEGRLRAFLSGQVAAIRAMVKRHEAVLPTELVSKINEEVAFQEKHHDELITAVFHGVK